MRPIPKAGRLTEMREPGFYWVRKRRLARWVVAEWDDGAWWVPGFDRDYDDDDMEQIGPRIQPPGE